MSVPLFIGIGVAVWAVLFLFVLALCNVASNTDDRTAAFVSSQTDWLWWA